MNNLEQRLARALHDQATADVPTTDLWPAIHAQLAVTPPRQRAWRTRLTSRPAQLAVVLALIVVVSGAAWILPGFFDSWDGGLLQVARAGLSQPIEQTQTIDGVTVTLNEAYADTERIAVVVTTTAPPGMSYSFQPAPEGLAGRNGTWLTESRLSDSYTGGEIKLGEQVFQEERAFLNYYPESIGSANGWLNLRLRVDVQPYRTGGTRWTPLPVVGPFIFDFSVPLNTATTHEISRTQQAAGVTMTLKRITVLPSMTNAVLCFDQPTPGPLWKPDATLVVDDLDDRGTWERLTGTDAGCGQLSFHLSVAQASGWILRVDELYRGGVETAEQLWPDPEAIVGPWEFHYPQPQPAPPIVLKRGESINRYGFGQGLQGIMLRIESRDGGLMYTLVCDEAMAYRGYQIDLFDQHVAVLDHGPNGPVQHCAAGQIVAAGGPIRPPGPFPLQFKVRLRIRDDSLVDSMEFNKRFIWDADGQVYYDDQ